MNKRGPFAEQTSRTCAIAVVLLVAASPANAAIYKWVDAKGMTHYGQQPPDSARNIQRMQSHHADSQSVERARERIDEQQQRLQEKRDQRQEAAARKAQEEKADKARRKRCHKARSRMATLKHSRNVLVDQDGNEPKRLTESERQARVGKLQKIANRNCSE